MLNKKEFEDMRKEYHDNDVLREDLIKRCRDLLKTSKQLIYAVHKEDLKSAEQYSKSALQITKELKEIARKSPQLEFSGAYREAFAEYIEAELYHHFVKNKRIPSYKTLGVDSESYLMGLSDLTGELVRKAVFLAGKGKVNEVLQIRDLIDDIYGEMLGFDLRNSELRKKFDSIKYNLRKLEDLVLDLKLKKR